MAKPLRSEDPNPKSVQFSHFGVLNDGERSRSAAVTSIVINVALALVIVILGMVVKTNPTLGKKIVELTLPPEPKPLPRPKIPPPPPPKPLPQPPKIEPPKVVMPKPVPQPKIQPMEVPHPKPVIEPPAPKRVSPPPAPKVVNLGVKAASIPNHDAHPSPVALGTNTAVRPLTGRPIQAVNLSGGMPGMNARNTGSGPRATAVNLGSGSPNGRDMNGRDRGAQPVAGFGTGVRGGTGRGREAGPVAVRIAPPSEMASAGGRPTEAMRSAQKPPTLIYKPTPVYPEAAKAAHLEGNVLCRIRVTASGGVEFLGITRGLGHGLDQSAEQVVHGMRFKPATDAGGRPVDWVGDVVVRFQLS